MTIFTLWEIVLDYFQLIHERTCPYYLAQEHPAEKLVEDFAREFFDCPFIDHREYEKLVKHFREHADLLERHCYSKVFSEANVFSLMESFPSAQEFKTREVKLASNSGRNSGESFELWRQDDNGNEFLVASYSCHYEAQLLRKRYERKGHKQHYWLRAIATAPAGTSHEARR